MTKADVWKIYLWILTVFCALGITGTFMEFSKLKLGDFSGVVEASLLTFGVFNYAFSKRILSQQVWKVIFILLVIVLILDVLYWYAPLAIFKQLLSFRETYQEIAWPIIVFGMTFFIPAYYATYQLGFKNKFLKQN